MLVKEKGIVICYFKYFVVFFLPISFAFIWSDGFSMCVTYYAKCRTWSDGWWPGAKRVGFPNGLDMSWRSASHLYCMAEMAERHS